MKARWGILLLALACSPGAAGAVGNEYRLDEFLSFPLAPRAAVRLQFGQHSSSTISDVGHLYFQAGVSLKATPWLTIMPAFRHARHEPWGDGSFYENRALLDFDARVEHGRWRPAFRTRVEGIFLERVSGFARVRLRPGVQYKLARGQRPPAAVANDEVFYDFRAGRWNRNRIQLGIALPVLKHLSLTPYYMLETNRDATRWKNKNIWGVTVHGDF